MDEQKDKKEIEKNILDFYYDSIKSKKIKASMYTISITLSTIAIFGGVGYLLDNYFATKPYIFIVLLVMSFPIGQILVYKKIKELFKN